jgi:hypothetical protein
VRGIDDIAGTDRGTVAEGLLALVLPLLALFRWGLTSIGAGPVVRETEVDLLRSLGRAIDDERDRSPFWRASSLFRVLAGMTGLLETIERVRCDCNCKFDYVRQLSRRFRMAHELTSISRMLSGVSVY